MTSKSTTTTGDVLLRDILENPRDDGLRLIYADWLEDNGMSQRAEYIRNQVALCDDKSQVDGVNLAGGPLTPLLLRVFYHSGIAEGYKLTDFSGDLITVGVPGTTVTFRPAVREGFSLECGRGFVSGVTMKSADFMKYAGDIFSEQPIERVILTDKSSLDNVTWSTYGFVGLPYAWQLPPEIYNLLPVKRWSRSLYETEAKRGAFMKRSLSVACVRYGRIKAGLSVERGHEADRKAMEEEKRYHARSLHKDA